MKSMKQRAFVRMLATWPSMHFVKRGPLYAQLHNAIGTASMPAASEWESHGMAITETLISAAPTVVDEALAARVYHLYLPIYFFARAQVRRDVARAGEGAVAIGLSAAQGSGKTTLVELLVERFAADGLACAAVSIDDFYLRGSDQDALARNHASNPLLQVRDP